MHLARLLFSIILLQTSVSCWAQETKPKSDTVAAPTTATATADAVGVLRKMHGHLIAAKDLELTTNFRSVDTGLGTTRSGKVHYILRKPNLMRVTATLANEKLVVVSDGKILTIHEPNKRRYREFDAKDSIVGNLYLTAGLVGKQVRMIDFFWSVDYLASVGGHAKLKKLPSRKVGAKTCDGFNIKYHDDDWSVWLERSNVLLPCLLISKSTDGNALTTQTNTVAWKAKPNITANTFRFVAPKAHKKD